MLIPDVNVLVHAHRSDSAEHEVNRDWLARQATGDEPLAIPNVVMSGFIRVVTHARVFSRPSTLDDALFVTRQLRSMASFVAVALGPRHWDIFTRLCADARATGNLVPDAYLAAIAVEAGAEIVTNDSDFAKLPGVRWRRPEPPS